MKQVITLKVNGEIHEIFTEPSRTLLEVIREDIGLTGTKEGCNEGDCGSCTVLINGRPELSCVLLAASVQGYEITTIEGLSDGSNLHPLQESFLEKGAVQCGFCTPGMLLTSKALLDRNANPTRDEIKRGISGNLCRCTGYQMIVDAIEDAGKKISANSKSE